MAEPVATFLFHHHYSLLLSFARDVTQISKNLIPVDISRLVHQSGQFIICKDVPHPRTNRRAREDYTNKEKTGAKLEAIRQHQSSH